MHFYTLHIPIFGISPIHSTPESFISLLISFTPKQSIQTALNFQFQFMQTHCDFFHWFWCLIFIEISCHWNLISFFVFFSSIHASGAYGNTSLLKYSLISSVSGTFSVSRRDISATGLPFFITISPFHLYGVVLRQSSGIQIPLYRIFCSGNKYLPYLHIQHHFQMHHMPLQSNHDTDP